jgi:glycine oxidase
VPDVLIIGAGIIGCAVAEALTWQGARVQLVDTRGVGEGATQASAGMLAPHSEGRHDPWLASFGVRSLALYEPLIERIGAVTAVAPAVARPGSLELALNDEEAAELRDRASNLQAQGIDSSLISGAAARSLEKNIAAECVAALHVPTHAYARVPDLIQALWRASSHRGAELTHGVVERIESTAGELRVVLRDQVLRAPVVVLAAGSWASQIDIAGIPPLPIRPIRGQLLQLTWHDAPLTHIIGGSACYTLTWPDGTMLAGATVEDVGFDDRATVGGVRDLLNGLCALVPRSSQASFTRVRVGFRPISPDLHPIIGRSGRVPGLIYATGHYRNGVLLAPVTGELVAKAVAGLDDPAFDVTNAQRLGDF